MDQPVFDLRIHKAAISAKEYFYDSVHGGLNWRYSAAVIPDANHACERSPNHD
jgi:hypothetical protein